MTRRFKQAGRNFAYYTNAFVAPDGYTLFYLPDGITYYSYADV